MPYRLGSAARKCEERFFHGETTRVASQGLAALRDRYLRHGRRRAAAEAGCAARRYSARPAAALDLRRAAAREAEGEGAVRRTGGTVPPLCEGSGTPAGRHEREPAALVGAPAGHPPLPPPTPPPPPPCP